jgi:putative RNA 2'-phosphotransferase
MTKRRETSKFLSFVLRHEPGAVGLELSKEGWVRVDDLLSALREHGRPLTREELEAIVATNDKQRFAFSADGARIRANQGHSVDVELGYESSMPPVVLYHDTVERFLASIHRDGLQKGEAPSSRNSRSLRTRSCVPHQRTLDAGFENV